MSVKERIESLLPEYVRLTDEMNRIEEKKHARTAALHHELREVSRSFEEDINRLDTQRKGIRDHILALWKKHFDKETTVTFPSAKISRRNYRELVIHDKIALLNALDRIGRLDLVEYTFTENEVARLFDDGELKGINPNALEITDHYNLQVRPKRNG
jgi:hypothetical protein